MKKFELTNLTRDYFIAPGETLKLYRIRALKNFTVGQPGTLDVLEVEAGRLGGWVENESNLSQADNCWVEENAVVYGEAHILGNALIKGYACVHGNVIISGNAIIKDSAIIYNAPENPAPTTVTWYATVKDHAQVCDGAFVGRNAVVKDWEKITR